MGTHVAHFLLSDGSDFHCGHFRGFTNHANYVLQRDKPLTKVYASAFAPSIPLARTTCPSLKSFFRSVYESFGQSHEYEQWNYVPAERSLLPVSEVRPIITDGKITTLQWSCLQRELPSFDDASACRAHRVRVRR